MQSKVYGLTTSTTFLKFRKECMLTLCLGLETLVLSMKELERMRDI